MGRRDQLLVLMALMPVSFLRVFAVAVACVLVIGAGLVLKSFWRLMQVSPGFATERVMTAQIELPQARYPDQPQILLFFETLFERLRHVPGVLAVGGTNALPMAGSGPTTAAMLLGKFTVVGSTKDLNPASLMHFSRTLRQPSAQTPPDRSCAGHTP